MLVRLALVAALALPALGHAADLTIEIDNIQAQRGRVMVAVMDSDAAWNGQGKPAPCTASVKTSSTPFRPYPSTAWAWRNPRRSGVIWKGWNGRTSAPLARWKTML